MQLKLSRQYLEDLSSYFMPFMLKQTASLERLHEDTEVELLHKICYSILKDIELMLARKKLTVQKNFNIRLKEAEAIILMQGLVNFPLPADHFWRNNLRNQIIEQLDKQIL